MKFTKKIFIFSYFPIKNIETIFPGDHKHRIISGSNYHSSMDSIELCHIKDIHSHFSEFGLLNDMFPLTYTITDYDESIISSLKLAEIKGIVIEIKSQNLSDALKAFSNELDSGYDLLNTFCVGLAESGFELNYKNLKINQYQDSYYQHLEDAKSDLREIAKEIFNIYKKNYCIYSNLPLVPAYG